MLLLYWTLFFSNVIEGSCLFLSRYRSDHQRLADIFVQKGPYLKMYSTYIRQFDNNVALLDEQCRKNTAFAAVVREFEVKLQKGLCVCFFIMCFPAVKVGIALLFLLLLHYYSWLQLTIISTNEWSIFLAKLLINWQKCNQVFSSFSFYKAVTSQFSFPGISINFLSGLFVIFFQTSNHSVD